MVTHALLAATQERHRLGCICLRCWHTKPETTTNLRQSVQVISTPSASSILCCGPKIAMPSSVAARAISVVVTFPPGYFLENIIALPDNTLLVTVANRKCLYSIPPPTEPGQSRVPVLLDQFPDDQWAFG